MNKQFLELNNIDLHENHSNNNNIRNEPTSQKKVPQVFTRLTYGNQNFGFFETLQFHHSDPKYSKNSVEYSERTKTVRLHIVKV